MHRLLLLLATGCVIVESRREVIVREGEAPLTADPSDPGVVPDTTDVADVSDPSTDDTDAPADTGAPPAGCVAVDEVCDGVDNDCDGTVDDVWFGGLGRGPAYRLTLRATGGAVDLPSATLLADVDFRRVLDQLGDGAAFDPASLRAVTGSCANGFAALPVQFEDGLVSLLDKVEHLDPVDERGVVGVAWDVDGDLATLESLPASAARFVHLYFDSVATAAPGLPAVPGTDLVVSPTSLSAGGATATFSAASGGLLTGLSLGASGVLTSQSEACCGNAVYGFQSGGWASPARAPGDLSVVAAGPVFGVLRATGERPVRSALGEDHGAYAYDHLFYMFARRPELWTSVHQWAVVDTINAHEQGLLSGFRPIQLRQVALGAQEPLYRSNEALGFASVTGDAWGVALGVARPPAYTAPLVNPPLNDEGEPYTDYLIYAGADVPVPAGPEMTLPAGTTYFDHPLFAVLPYAGSFEPEKDAFVARMAGVSTETFGAVVRE